MFLHPGGRGSAASCPPGCSASTTSCREMQPAVTRLLCRFPISSRHRCLRFLFPIVRLFPHFGRSSSAEVFKGNPQHLLSPRRTCNHAAARSSAPFRCFRNKHPPVSRNCWFFPSSSSVTERCNQSLTQREFRRYLYSTLNVKSHSKFISNNEQFSKSYLPGSMIAPPIRTVPRQVYICLVT